MSALIIYFILTSDHRWEFWTIERTDNVAYCVLLKEESQAVFADAPGNIRVVCALDCETET